MSTPQSAFHFIFLTKSKEKENHSGFWTKREDQKFNMFKKCRHPCLNANMPKTSDQNLRFHCLQYFFNSWSNIILTDLFPGAIWYILRLCLELLLLLLNVKCKLQSDLDIYWTMLTMEGVQIIKMEIQNGICISLVWQFWFGRFGLVCLAWYVGFGRFGLVGLVK